MNKDIEKGPIAIIGAGGHATIVASTLLAAGHDVDGFYDDNPTARGIKILGIPVKGPINTLSRDNCAGAILGIGANETRKRLANELSLNWITVVHPFSYVDPSAKLGRGTIVCAGSIVQASATIGSHVIINTKASVDHHAYVGDFSHIAVAHLAGGASLEEGGFLGLHSTVLPGVNVGAWTTVGAGAVVTTDISANITVIGTPARPVKRRSC